MNKHTIDQGKPPWQKLASSLVLEHLWVFTCIKLRKQEKQRSAR
jgi:hypothetical protein